MRHAGAIAVIAATLALVCEYYAEAYSDIFKIATIVAGAVFCYGYLVVPKHFQVDDYPSRIATRNDVFKIHRRIMSYNPNAMPHNVRLEIFKKCNQAFQIFGIKGAVPTIRKERSDILVVYPLNDQATDLVEAGDWTGGDLTASSLTPSFSSASSVYVGYFESSRHTIAAAMVDHLRALARKGKGNAAKIFMIPTTEDALKLAKRRKFRTLDGGEPRLDTMAVRYDA